MNAHACAYSPATTFALGRGEGAYVRDSFLCVELIQVREQSWLESMHDDSSAWYMYVYSSCCKDHKRAHPKIVSVQD
jgi:hypothetical protein